MTQPQQPFGHVSEPWPAVPFCVHATARVLEQRTDILAARVAELDRRLAELTREERA